MVAKGILLVGVIFTIVTAASGTTFALYQSGLIFHTSSSSSKLQVLATFYPQYDFTQNIGGDKISLSLLVPMTVDVHSFEPTPPRSSKWRALEFWSTMELAWNLGSRRL